MKKIVFLILFLGACCPFPRFWNYNLIEQKNIKTESSPYPFSKWEELKDQYSYRVFRRLIGENLVINLTSLDVSVKETELCRQSDENNDFIKLQIGFQTYKDYDKYTYLFDTKKIMLEYKDGIVGNDKILLNGVKGKIYNVAGRRDAEYLWKRNFELTICAANIKAVKIDGVTRNKQELPPYYLELFPSMFDADSFLGRLLK